VFKKLRWYHTVVLASMTLAVGMLALLFFPALPDTHPSQTIVRVSTIKAASLRLEGRLERNRIEDEAPDALEITVVNDSDRDTNLHLSLNAPGFELDQTKLACNGANGALDLLPPHKSCQFKLNLAPAARSGTYGVTTFLHWTQKGGGFDQASLQFGPVVIDRNWGAARWTRMGRRMGTLLKDLTLPLLLAVLGAYFARQQSTRDAAIRAEEAARDAARIEREKNAETARATADEGKERDRMEAEKTAEQKRINAEKARDELRRDALIEQAERQDVRHLLLTRVMELAEQHYLLFVNHTRLILTEAGKILSDKPDAAPDKLFLHVLFMLKRMEVFRLSKGGIFFKGRGGERTVGAAWFLLKTKFYAALGDENAAAALNIVHSDWDYATYKKRFAELDPAWIQFQTWLKEPENSIAPAGSFWQMLGTLDAFQAVMAFEADRALSKYWYEEDGKLTFLLDPPTVLYVGKLAIDYEKTKTSELEVLLRDQYGRAVRIERIS
jgi:hypothetical protein